MFQVIIWSINYAGFEHSSEEGYGVCCLHGHVGFAANKNPVKSLSERETGLKIGKSG